MYFLNSLLGSGHWKPDVIFKALITDQIHDTMGQSKVYLGWDNAHHVPFLILTLLGSVQTPYLCWLLKYQCFSDSSVGKESTCNAEAPGSIPGSGRSAEEGIGYPLQYSWASPVAQLVKGPPAMWETWVRFLGWEDLLEKGQKGKATHSSILAWRILRTV